MIFTVLFSVLLFLCAAEKIFPFFTFSSWGFFIGTYLAMMLMKAFRKDWSSPGFLLVAVSGMSLFLSSLDVEFIPRLSHFNIPVSTRTICTFIGAVAVFLAGTALVSFFAAPPVPEFPDSGIKKKLSFYARYSFLLALMVYLLSVFRLGGLVVFQDDLNSARSDFILPFWGNLLCGFELSVFFGAVKIFRFTWRESKPELVMIVLSFVFCFLSTQRIGAVVCFIMLFGAWVYTHPGLLSNYRIPLRRTIPVCMVLTLFILFFIKVGNIRMGASADRSPLLTELPSFFIEHLYVYLSGPSLHNLDMVVNPDGVFYNDIVFKNGMMFFRPFLWFTPLREQLRVGNIFSGPNNATALYEYYLDLGVCGMFLIPFFWGLFSQYVYTKMKNEHILGYGLVYCYVLQGTLFFTISEKFSSPGGAVVLLFVSGMFLVESLLRRARVSQKGKA